MLLTLTKMHSLVDTVSLKLTLISYIYIINHYNVFRKYLSVSHSHQNHSLLFSVEIFYKMEHINHLVLMYPTSCTILCLIASQTRL